MDIMERVELLKSCELVNEKGYKDLLAIIQVFHEQGIRLTEENGGMMITHIAAAFKRVDDKEKVEPLDPLVVEALQEESIYEQAVGIIQAVKRSICYVLSEDEYAFILVHIARVLESERGEGI